MHPLITVVDLREATKALNNVQINYEVYAVFLKMYKTCDLRYGRRPYDYQDGTIVSFAPGQSVTVTNSSQVSQPVIGLLFHPDLIHGTSLGRNIRKYSFFSYASNEALHLSEEERQIFLDCLKHIQSELKNATDKHSRSLIVMNIELALNYCLRFYERQFVTRQQESNDILVKFEELIDNYFTSKMPPPTVCPPSSTLQTRFASHPTISAIWSRNLPARQPTITYKARSSTSPRKGFLAPKPLSARSLTH